MRHAVNAYKKAAARQETPYRRQTSEFCGIQCRSTICYSRCCTREYEVHCQQGGEGRLKSHLGGGNLCRVNLVDLKMG